jgi:hypothetical protein
MKLGTSVRGSRSAEPRIDAGHRGHLRQAVDSGSRHEKSSTPFCQDTSLGITAPPRPRGRPDVDREPARSTMDREENPDVSPWIATAALAVAGATSTGWTPRASREEAAPRGPA